MDKKCCITFSCYSFLIASGRGVKQKKCISELQAAGVEVEEGGGSVPVVPISALTGLGVDKLKETILTVAGLLDLKADRCGFRSFSRASFALISWIEMARLKWRSSRAASTATKGS